jgi:ribonuclease P protein component
LDRLRFQTHQHIKSTKHFDRVFREGSRARSNLMVVAVAANGLEHSRLGLSVGKRIWKSAVKRNRVRRIFREAFRLEQHALPPGLDMVLVPAQPKLVPDLASARSELVAMARKASKRYAEKLAKASAEQTS